MLMKVYGKIQASKGDAGWPSKTGGKSGGGRRNA
jgi:hypothetical protein